MLWQCFTWHERTGWNERPPPCQGHAGCSSYLFILVFLPNCYQRRCCRCVGRVQTAVNLIRGEDVCLMCSFTSDSDVWLTEMPLVWVCVCVIKTNNHASVVLAMTAQAARKHHRSLLRTNWTIHGRPYVTAVQQTHSTEHTHTGHTLWHFQESVCLRLYKACEQAHVSISWFLKSE